MVGGPTARVSRTLGLDLCPVLSVASLQETAVGECGLTDQPVLRAREEHGSGNVNRGGGNARYRPAFSLSKLV